MNALEQAEEILDRALRNDVGYPNLMAESSAEERQLLVEIEKCLLHYGLSFADIADIDKITSTVPFYQSVWLNGAVDDWSALRRQRLDQ